MKNRKLLLVALLPVTALLLMAATGTLYRGKFVDGGYNPAFIGDGGGLTNIQNSSITNVVSAVIPSDQTNYSLTIYPNGFKYIIYTANTNVDFAIVAAPGFPIVAGAGASVFVNAITSSATARVSFDTGAGLGYLTNVNLGSFVTNGFGQWYNFESLDATGTNITVISGGLHRR